VARRRFDASLRKAGSPVPEKPFDVEDRIKPGPDERNRPPNQQASL